MTFDKMYAEMQKICGLPPRLLDSVTDKPMTATEVQMRREAFDKHVNEVMQPVIDRLHIKLCQTVFNNIYIDC